MTKRRVPERRILADCGAAVVLSQLHLSGRLPLSGPRVVYLADVRLPTEKAHGWQIVKMCEAFAAAVRPGKTQLVFAETPANPKLAIVDLEELGAIGVSADTHAPAALDQHLHRAVRQLQ